MATFGRYEILDKLGEGAMGIVYRAQDQTLGRVVALKMLSADLVADEELHQRFQREAEAIGRLNHPNIVTVYDLGKSEGRLFMAMELLDGDDLRSLIERQITIPLADRLRVLAQICDGLGYAHSKGVVHRDIKPANIVVTSNGRVKLLDFGLARVATRATITKRGVILGTPDYMSPEQATGKSLDHRTDMFSAGAVFYEFLTLQKPFKGKTLHSVLYQIISEDPEPVLTLNPELPSRVAVVVQRMLQKEPARRYSSMEQVGQTLREIHTALRRSRSRSALPLEETADGEAGRVEARDHVAAGRVHVEAGRLTKAVEEMENALALDPDCEEAAEILWAASHRLRGGKPEPPPPTPESAARVSALLDQASKGQSEADARQAVAALALIAPDDPRVLEVLRKRAGKAH